MSSNIRTVVPAILLLAAVTAPSVTAATKYTFQLIDPPAGHGVGDAVQIAWINNRGLMTVQYQAPEDADWYTNTHTAIVDRGVWLNIDVPGAAATLGTNANSRGQIALSYTTTYPDNPDWKVAIWDRGRLTPFNVPGYQVIANAINDVGEIAAAAIDADGYWHCFAGSAKNHAVFDYPATDLAFSQVMGINNSGVVAGSYSQYPNALDGHGFLLQKGRFTRFDMPGAKWTNFTSINNAGMIAGTFGLAGADGEFDGVWHGFVLSHGVYEVVDLPGGASTIPYWINDRGQVGGMCYDADWGMHGFIASPGVPRR